MAVNMGADCQPVTGLSDHHADDNLNLAEDSKKVAAAGVLVAGTGAAGAAAGCTATGAAGAVGLTTASYTGAALISMGGAVVTAPLTSAAVAGVGVVAAAKGISKANVGLSSENPYPFVLYGPADLSIATPDFRKDGLKHECCDIGLRIEVPEPTQRKLGDRKSLKGVARINAPGVRLESKQTAIAPWCNTEYQVAIVCENGFTYGYNRAELFNQFKAKVGNKDSNYICAYYTQAANDITRTARNSTFATSAAAKVWSLVKLTHENRHYEFYVMIRAEGLDDHIWYLGSPSATRQIVADGLQSYLQIPSKENDKHVLRVHPANTYADSHATGTISASGDSFALDFVDLSNVTGPQRHGA